MARNNLMLFSDDFDEKLKDYVSHLGINLIAWLLDIDNVRLMLYKNQYDLVLNGF